VPGPNDALAAVLERGRPAEDSDALLAALVDGGVYVPVDDRGSVMFIGVDDTGPVLPGYASEEDRQRLLPDATTSVLCDAPRLLDIANHTSVRTLVVFGGPGWVKIPLQLVAATLSERGPRAQGGLTWSTDPVAVAMRDGFAARILEFPPVRTVWIAQAPEQLVVFMAVGEGARSAAEALMETASVENVALRVLEPHETDRAAELDPLGLDTVRADHTTGRVQIVSRQYD
jgi:hypothetical protein